MLPCAIKCATCGSIFDPARIRRELADLETKLADPALWNNPAASKPLMRDRKRLENLVADDEELVRRSGDIEAYFELAREGEDVLADLERDIKALAAFNEELGSPNDVVRRGRSAQRYRHCPSRSRRHGEPGLGRDADAHVPALGPNSRASRPR